MRVFGTVVLGLVFLAAFSAFFLFRSVVAWPTEPAGVVDALRAADVRKAALDALERNVRERVSRVDDPVFGGVVLSEARSAIEQVIPEEWFYRTVGEAHRGLVEFLETGRDTVDIDLRAKKEELQRLLTEIGPRAEQICNLVRPEAECRTMRRDIRKNLRMYDGQIQEAMRSVPDHANLTWLLSRAGQAAGRRPAPLDASPEMIRVRSAFETLRVIRWLGLVALAVLLLLIGLVNVRTVPRMLVNVGLVVALSAAIFLASVGSLGNAIASAADREMSRVPVAGVPPADVAAIRETARRASSAAFEGMFGGPDGTVVVALCAGSGLFLFGVAAHVVRRRRVSAATARTPGSSPFAGPWRAS